jgi:hypothetical protein
MMAIDVDRGIKTCRACSGNNLFLALNLGSSPIANSLSASPDSHADRFPLELRICSDCALGQLGEFKSESAIFEDYPYLSSTSSSWLESNKLFASEMVDLRKLNESSLVLEIASNDGYLLSEFQAKHVRVLGIEPAKNVALLAEAKGVETISEFFGESLATRLLSQCGSPNLIVGKNVLAHVPDIQDFVSGISILSDLETLVVIESPLIDQILTGLQFDTIYHEHFSYLSVTSIEKLFGVFGMELIGAQRVSTHGGSARIFARKAGSKLSLPAKFREDLSDLLRSEEALQINSEFTWEILQGRVKNCIQDFANWTDSMKGEAIVGFGAAAKGVTFLHAAERADSFSAIIDNSPQKEGRYFPGTKVRIISQARFEELEIENSIFLILPWNLREEISREIWKSKENARIFVAVPELRELSPG